MNPKSGTLKWYIEEATHRVMLNIQALLESANMQMKDIVKCSIFLKDMADFSVVNEIYSSYFEGISGSRNCAVAKLPLDVDKFLVSRKK